MTEHEKLDMEKINEAIADRSGVFYWQTDRAVEPADAGKIWADRHKYFTDDELIKAVNSSIGEDKLVAIDPLDLEAQTNLGNVNSVRVGALTSGKEIIIRNHPKGIENGYFHAEAAAARLAKNAGLPSYDTLAIHDYDGDGDFAFQVLEKLPGMTMNRWLENCPDSEPTLLLEAGKMMARLHQIHVDGFGPFNNDRAKKGELTGLQATFGNAVRAGLLFNLDVLTKEHVFTPEQSAVISKLFSDDNTLLDTEQAVLVHNDFADWNLLTDGIDITGILDWDECVGGDAIADIACWSTFFEPERLKGFLEGYWQVAQKPDNFDAKFELLRLRYVISKMTLRLRRYSWDPSDFMKEKIESGRTHLAQSMAYFGIS